MVNKYGRFHGAAGDTGNGRSEVPEDIAVMFDPGQGRQV